MYGEGVSEERSGRALAVQGAIDQIKENLEKVQLCLDEAIRCRLRRFRRVVFLSISLSAFSGSPRPYHRNIRSGIFWEDDFSHAYRGRSTKDGRAARLLMRNMRSQPCPESRRAR